MPNVFRMPYLKEVERQNDDEYEEKVKSVPSLLKKKKEREGFEFIAPDGGWGWVVTLACGMSNFSVIPLTQNYGLIYKEKYEEWGITHAEYTFMRNLEFSISNCIGLFTGALLKKYGFRKMSLIGGFLTALAILITSQVTTITYFIVFHAILGGVARGITRPSLALAINTYFKKRRGIATGLSWTATGLSPVLMPQLITLLMKIYDVHGTVLILSAISLHIIPASLLLHPVKWHGKWVKTQKEIIEIQEKEEEFKTFFDVPLGEENACSESITTSPRKAQADSVDKDGEYKSCIKPTLNSDDQPPSSRNSSRGSFVSAEAQQHSKVGYIREESERLWMEECPSIKLPADILDEKKKKNREETRTSSYKAFWKRAVKAIVSFFDLTILKDSKFVIILLGMTLSFTAEVNFTILVPFVYSEFGFEMETVALFMSLLALIDLVARFTIPFLTDKLELDPKMCFSFGLMILASARIVLAHTKDFKTILAASIWMGFGRGIRIVYMSLVIPSYVPLDRLPTASGLHMFANGVAFIVIGPLLGYLRDNSDNYAASLHCINLMTYTAVGLWTVDSLVTWCKTRRSEKDAKERVKYTPKSTSLKEK